MWLTLTAALPSDGGNGNRRSPWWHKRENILLVLGITIIMGSFINSEVLGRTFHYEFLLAGLALCGVGLAQLGDKR